MKIIHISDLHIGKRVGEFNMLEDQEHILHQILKLTDEVRPVAVIIAGDIYDKSVPAGEAVEILDNFLTELVSRKIQLFIVSGNHDSPERLNFGSRIMQTNGVHIAGTFAGGLKPISIQDELGPVNVYLLPFIKPAMVRQYFTENDIQSYDEAVAAVINSVPVNLDERNILVAHQFITNGSQQPERSESETISIGGLDNIEVSIFAPFDYVALGHLHGPQCIGRETVRYAGSPLKYSFSETRQHKSITVIELFKKGNIDIKTIELMPLHDMREIKGPIEELVNINDPAFEASRDYIRAILTNEGEVYDAIGQLRRCYPNIMRIDFENRRSKQNILSKTAASGDVTSKSPIELFSEFYANQNNMEITNEQHCILNEIIEQVGGVTK